MQFVIRATAGPMPNLSLGPPGKELQCYLPAGVVWRQINYGQGEGQVEIDGCEWGVYQTTCGGLALILHTGELNALDGLAFAQKVAEKIIGPAGFEVYLKGTGD